MKPAKVMEYLGINRKFIISMKSSRWGRSSSAIDTEPSIDNDGGAESARSSQPGGDDRARVPYIEAIREIEKI